MKLPNKQSGFSHIVLVALILLVVGGVGFAGWKVYEAKNKKPMETSTPTQPTQNKTEESNIPKGFVKYREEELGFSFAYPKDWKIETERRSSHVLVTLKSPDYKDDGATDRSPEVLAGAKFTIKVVAAEGNIIGYKEKDFDSCKNYEKCITVDGQRAGRGEYGDGPEKTTMIETSFLYKDNWYSIIYAHPLNKKDEHLVKYNTLINTFELNK